MLPPKVTPESIEGYVCDGRAGLHWAPQESMSGVGLAEAWLG